MSYVILKKSATMVGALSLVGIIGFSISGLPSSNLAASTIKGAPVSIVLNRDVPSSFSKTIEKVGPAVVSIRVTSREPEMAAQMPVMPEPFARFFGKNFGFQFGNPGQRVPRGTPQTQGIGSGFFIDAEGHVVTNEHVIRNAETIKITLKDGETFEAKLVGKDLKTDLALLKVEADRPLPFVRFGNSSKVMVGDWVIALGSPFGLGHTATTGIVSATGRDIGAGPYDDYLQIDASINRGNSGGPTFNTLGEVVGVNTAIISPTGVSAGIGFAVPSDMAKSVIAQLQSNGSVSRGWLGVSIQKVTKDLAAGLGMTKPEGALITSVMKGSPAEVAGLMPGDVIVAVTRKPIIKMRELSRRIASLDAGQSADLEVIRGGRSQTIGVRIGIMPGSEQLARASSADSKVSNFGMELSAIDGQIRATLGIGQDVAGVAVVMVNPHSVAAKRGIRRGDVVRRILGEKVSEPTDVSRLIAEARSHARKKKRETVLVLINRKGKDRYIALPLRSV